MGAIEIRGPQVWLRDFVPDDVDVIAEYTADPEVCRYLSWGPMTRDEASRYVSNAIKAINTSPRTWYELAIVLPERDELVGHVGLGLGRQQGTAEYGYVLRPHFWGLGIAKAASRLALDYAFEELDLHRVWASCDERNHASVRVLEKLGFSLEGRHRDDIFVRGEWRTSLIYGVLHDEWLNSSSSPRA